jgi:hypothetical protein
LTKSHIVERSVEARQVARVAELEKANAQLCMELDVARSKLVEVDVVWSKLAEVEHCEWTLTSEYEDLKNDFESLHISHDAVVREKAEVVKTERVKLQRFQDSLRKKLAELRCDTEASVATLKGRNTEFPTSASLSNFLEWFQAEVAAMPTAFAESNENITCYALVGIFQMLVEGRV